MDNIRNESIAPLESSSKNNSYLTRGFRDASSQQGNLNAFRSKASEEICNEHIIDSEKQKKKEIEKKENELAQLNRKIDQDKKDINKKEDERNKLQEENEPKNPPDKLSLYILGAIVVILGVALFLFYGLTISGVINTLIRSNEQTSQTQATIPTLWDNFITLPFYLKIISILLSILPIGIGYLIHMYKKQKQWLFLLIILIFVFILDVVIAFVVEKQIYGQEALFTELPPFKDYVMQNVLGTFGAIILLGFGAYVIWGLLFDSFILQLNPQFGKDKNKKRLKTSDTEIDLLKNQVKESQQLIELIEKSLVDLHNSAILYCNRRELETHLAEYSSGWTQFFNGYYDRPTADQTISELYKIKDEVITAFCARFKFLESNDNNN
jgi:hypothetical protein